MRVEYKIRLSVYARQLLPKRHGYPLWVPEPYGNSVPYRTKGVRIGDVGYVTEDGAFETLFNVRASPSDPINCRGVPEGFEQVRISTEDIVHIPNFHPQEGIVTSASMKKRTMNIELSTPEILTNSPGAGSSFQFTWASSQGAILHLPTGACRLTSPAELFRDVAVRGAKNWYRFANETLRRSVPNGGLYLITGCDKTASWMVGAFSERSLDSQVSFLLSILGCNTGAAYSYTWDTSCPAVFRTGPSLPPIDSIDDLLRNRSRIAQDDSIFAADAPNGKTQCAFVRGYRIMLRTTPMSLIRGSANKIEVSSISSINPKDTAHSAMHRRYVDRPTACGFVSNSRRDHEILSNSDISLSEDLDRTSEEISLEYLPEGNVLYHPSTSINELLLRLSPEAMVSLVHDDEWISVLHEDEAELPDDTVLLSRIFEKYSCAKWASAVSLAAHVSAMAPLNPTDPAKDRLEKHFEVRKALEHRDQEQGTERSDEQIVGKIGPQTSISNVQFEDYGGHTSLFTEITNSLPPRNCLPRRRIKPNGRPRTEPTKLSYGGDERVWIMRRQKSLDFSLRN